MSNEPTSVPDGPTDSDMGGDNNHEACEGGPSGSSSSCTSEPLASALEMLTLVTGTAETTDDMGAINDTPVASSNEDSGEAMTYDQKRQLHKDLNKLPGSMFLTECFCSSTIRYHSIIHCQPLLKEFLNKYFDVNDYLFLFRKCVCFCFVLCRQII